MSKSNYEIVDIFESVKDDLIVTQPYVSINKNLKNFTTTTFSVAVPIEFKQDFNIDYDAEMLKLIRNEMNQSLYKSILKELFDTSKFDYVDISKTVNTHQSVNDIINFLGINYFDNRYKYLVTNTQMANSLGDSSQFHFQPMNDSKVVEFNGIPYQFGHLMNYDVFLDPYMKFDDNRICLFDSCEINVENVSQQITSIATFNPRMLVSYDLAYSLGDSKVLFILDGDQSSTSYKQYKQLQRDIKIDSLLDGKEENTL